MIPRIILKKIRQIEIRTNRIAAKSVPRAHPRIPTGFRPPAQGCEERATLGYRHTIIPNRNAVAAIPVSSPARGACHNPVGVVENLISSTQGSSCVATLGCTPQSRWDWPNRTNLPFVIRHSPHMIPREILKKIRQIELRTNCIVTETLSSAE